mmetsp:Transcript_495/g.1909  ORF Transcript_495/g.1909 Transcript_495/m.1909 type:complete len:238 (-) Transcript_495:677-1390(-)
MRALFDPSGAVVVLASHSLQKGERGAALFGCLPRVELARDVVEHGFDVLRSSEVLGGLRGGLGVERGEARALLGGLAEGEAVVEERLEVGLGERLEPREEALGRAVGVARRVGQVVAREDVDGEELAVARLRLGVLDARERLAGVVDEQCARDLVEHGGQHDRNHQRERRGDAALGRRVVTARRSSRRVDERVGRVVEEGHDVEEEPELVVDGELARHGAERLPEGVARRVEAEALA